MSIVGDELKAARAKLLDLTLRNRLLNYRPAKARAIRVVDELPGRWTPVLGQPEHGSKL
jgi:hypothetical protein